MSCSDRTARAVAHLHMQPLHLRLQALLALTTRLHQSLQLMHLSDLLLEPCERLILRVQQGRGPAPGLGALLQPREGLQQR